MASSVTTEYSHAAPYIRRKLLESAHTANTAQTERSRREARARVHAFAEALEVMAASKDQPEPPRGYGEDDLPPNSRSEALSILGESRWGRLGFDEEDLTPQR